MSTRKGKNRAATHYDHTRPHNKELDYTKTLPTTKLEAGKGSLFLEFSDFFAHRFFPNQNSDFFGFFRTISLTVEFLPFFEFLPTERSTVFWYWFLSQILIDQFFLKFFTREARNKLVVLWCFWVHFEVHARSNNSETACVLFG